jgi:hypothetical protein
MSLENFSRKPIPARAVIEEKEERQQAEESELLARVLTAAQPVQGEKTVSAETRNTPRELEADKKVHPVYDQPRQ